MQKNTLNSLTKLAAMDVRHWQPGFLAGVAVLCRHRCRSYTQGVRKEFSDDFWDLAAPMSAASRDGMRTKQMAPKKRITLISWHNSNEAFEIQYQPQPCRPNKNVAPAIFKNMKEKVRKLMNSTGEHLRAVLFWAIMAKCSLISKWCRCCRPSK